MNVAEYLVEFLYTKGVTDAFGIPGGVILDLMYAMQHSDKKIIPHLCYHEQAAAFAANGYAQVYGNLGVAYATRGPGITNMITAIADAYYDSIPVMYITAHSSIHKGNGMRIEVDQELNPVPLLENITKYAVRIDDIRDVIGCIHNAYEKAMSGRKGPVLLDFSSKLFKETIGVADERCTCLQIYKVEDNIKKIIEDFLNYSKRPVFIVGDGINQAGLSVEFRELLGDISIPIISSRFSQDIMQGKGNYYGYLGSHGTRYTNFILSKADLIITIGNRMSFPVDSKSFKPIFDRAKVIRFDIDTTEFLREVPNSVNINIDLKELLTILQNVKWNCYDNKDWLEVCNELKAELFTYDVTEPVEKCANILRRLPIDCTIVSDVGNNEFWLSRAYAYSKITNRLLFSKSFGALGCGLPKAIGAYYATHKPVVCFVGDQGFQLNIQELEYLSVNNIPLVICLMNNNCSGMIKDRENSRFMGELLHTTRCTGYGIPNISSVCVAYGIEMETYPLFDNQLSAIKKAILINVKLNEENTLEPYLDIGQQCQNMSPKLESKLLLRLDAL